MENEEKQEHKEDLEQKLEEKEEEIEEWKDHYMRLKADFENYQKHVQRQQKKFVETAHKDLIQDLLDILDSFDEAIPSLKKQDPDAAKGIEMIYNNLRNKLKKHGLKPIEAMGKKFDPYIHDVLLEEESDQEKGTIIEEYQKGYMLNDNIIRHSKVKVSKGKQNDNEVEEND